MAENNSTHSGGIGVIGLLGVAFVVLKLCGVIGWSWWWVTAPFWGGLAIFIILASVLFVVWYIKELDERKRLASGMNYISWKNRKKKKPDIISQPPLSKWEQRIEEMKNRNTKQ